MSDSRVGFRLGYPVAAAMSCAVLLACRAPQGAARAHDGTLAEAAASSAPSPTENATSDAAPRAAPDAARIEGPRVQCSPALSVSGLGTWYAGYVTGHADDRAYRLWSRKSGHFERMAIDPRGHATAYQLQLFPLDSGALVTLLGGSQGSPSGNDFVWDEARSRWRGLEPRAVPHDTFGSDGHVPIRVASGCHPSDPTPSGKPREGERETCRTELSAERGDRWEPMPPFDWRSPDGYDTRATVSALSGGGVVAWATEVGHLDSWISYWRGGAHASMKAPPDRLVSTRHTAAIHEGKLTLAFDARQAGQHRIEMQAWDEAHSHWNKVGPPLQAPPVNPRALACTPRILAVVGDPLRVAWLDCAGLEEPRQVHLMKLEGANWTDAYPPLRASHGFGHCERDDVAAASWGRDGPVVLLLGADLSAEVWSGSSGGWNHWGKFREDAP